MLMVNELQNMNNWDFKWLPTGYGDAGFASYWDSNRIIWILIFCYSSIKDKRVFWKIEQL